MNKGVPKDTVYLSTSKKTKKAWHTRTHPSNNRLRLIAYSSIPQDFKEKFNLPSFSELFDIEAIQNSKLKKEENVTVSKIIMASLDFEYSQWESFKPIYVNKFASEEKVEIYCKTHAVLSQIIEMKGNGFKLIDLYHAYNQYEGLAFESINYNSFCNKVRKIEKSKNIELEIIHGLRNHLSNNYKRKDDVVTEIIYWFQDPKKLNAKQILEKTNEYLTRKNRKSVSLSFVQKILSQPYIKNQAMISRFGDRYTEDHLLPHGHFVAPSFEGSVWHVDGTRFQFYYKTEISKFNSLTLYVVLDGCSKKIIGYSSGESENTEITLQAIKMACESTGYLPRELISDNSKVFESKVFERIISNAKLWGVNWRQEYGFNPRDNSQVERFFGVFQESFCKKYDGYLGDGIKSRNIYGKPSPEEKKKHLATKNLKTKEELQSFLAELIEEYNISKHREGIVKKDVFSKEMQSKKKCTPILLNEVKNAMLFWNEKIITVDNSSIVFFISKEKFVYNVYDEGFTLRYNGMKIRIRYNLKDMSNILLFNFNNDEFICSAKRFPNISKSSYERDEMQNIDLHKHITAKRETKQRIAKKNKAIQEKRKQNVELLPPEITLYMPTSKIQGEETEKELLRTEAENQAALEKFKTITNEEDSENLEDMFKNIYSKKGSLKPFNYGSN